MTRFYWLLAVVLLFCHAEVQGMLSPTAFGFSSLLQKADLVVKGEIVEISIQPGEYRMSFVVGEVLLGVAQPQPLQIVVPLARASRLRIPHEPYLEKGAFLLCLTPDAETGVWRIANAEAGVLHIDSAEDVRRVIALYQSQEHLFSDSRALQQLFTASRHWEARRRLLEDLKPVLSTADHAFLASLLSSREENLQAFAARQAGRHRITSLQETLLDLVETTPHQGVKVACIAGLGD